jgi:tyrosine-protein phosphatase non-receptor type 23
MELELQSLLHNIGALHSELGSLGIRETSENKKMACTHFQCAAWAFECIRENQQCPSKDLRGEIVSYNQQTMLAQAQECVLEKSIVDQRKPLIIARVAAQVVDYYGNVLALLMQSSLSQQSDSLHELLGSKQFKEWKEFTEFKVSYYSAVTSLFMGNSTDIAIGHRIAWYNAAAEKVKVALKLTKYGDRVDLVDAVNHLNDLLEKQLQEAKRENDFIYHEAVPGADQLTAVSGVTLIKSTPFDVADPEICGPDIFHRLVPIEAYEQVSIYSDSKDRLWRETKQKIESRNEELVSFLSVLQLDKDQIRFRKYQVPKELAQVCASLSLKPAIVEETADQLSRLDELCKQVTVKLDQGQEVSRKLDQLLKDKRPTERKETDDLIKELNSIAESVKTASASNKALREKFDASLEDIKVLLNSSITDLERMFSTSSDQLPSDESNLQEMETIFDKVDEMRQQRTTLEERLHKNIETDDILKKILVHPKDKLNQLFENELKKHDETIEYLNLNLSAQNNVIEALTRANAKYTETRKAFAQIDLDRQKKVESLMLSHASFDTVVRNTSEGAEFFEHIKGDMDKLCARLVKLFEQKEIESKRRPVPQPPIQSKLPDMPIAPSANYMPTAPPAPKIHNYMPTHSSAMGANRPAPGQSFTTLPASFGPMPTTGTSMQMHTTNPTYPTAQTNAYGYPAQAVHPTISTYPYSPYNHNAPPPVTQPTAFPYALPNPNAMYSAYTGYPMSQAPISNYPSSTVSGSSAVPRPNVTYAAPLPAPYSSYSSIAPPMQHPSNQPLEYQIQNMHIHSNPNAPHLNQFNYGKCSDFTHLIQFNLTHECLLALTGPNYGQYPTAAAVPKPPAPNIMNTENDLSTESQPILQPICLNLHNQPQAPPKDPPPSLL